MNINEVLYIVEEVFEKVFEVFDIVEEVFEKVFDVIHPNFCDLSF